MLTQSLPAAFLYPNGANGGVVETVNPARAPAEGDTRMMGMRKQVIPHAKPPAIFTRERMLSYALPAAFLYPNDGNAESAYAARAAGSQPGERMFFA